LEINRAAPVFHETEILVPAPPEVVWAVLTDFAGWTSWNPGVEHVDVRGPLQAGTEFAWKAGGIGIRSMLQDVSPPARISWTGEAMGLHAIHAWRLAPEAGGTRVHTQESFEGALASLMKGKLQKTLSETLDKGLSALKAECLRRTGAGS